MMTISAPGVDNLPRLRGCRQLYHQVTKLYFLPIIICLTSGQFLTQVVEVENPNCFFTFFSFK
jgi:hypothetical protein